MWQMAVLLCAVAPCRAFSILSPPRNAAMPSQSTSANPPFVPAIQHLLVIQPIQVKVSQSGQAEPLGHDSKEPLGTVTNSPEDCSDQKLVVTWPAVPALPETTGPSRRLRALGDRGPRLAGAASETISSAAPLRAVPIGGAGAGVTTSAKNSPTKKGSGSYVQDTREISAASGAADGSDGDGIGDTVTSPVTELLRDKYASVQAANHCDPAVESMGLDWNQTECGMIAAQPCPVGYEGTVYRPCYSSGLWGASDFSDCRLERLANIRNLIYYHLHNNLIEGLYHLADDLARYLASADMRSPMDRLDTMDALSSVLRTKLTLKLRNGFDIAFVQSLLESVNQILVRKTVGFTSESKKVSLLAAKAGEMVLSLSAFVDTALTGFRLSDLKEVALSASENIVLNLRRKQLKEQPVLLYTNDSQITAIRLADDYPPGSVRAALVLRGLGNLFDNDVVSLQSDLLVLSFLPQAGAANLSSHFDVAMNYRQSKQPHVLLECASIWNTTWLWSNENCRLVDQTEQTVTCRCLHSGNVAAVRRKDWLKRPGPGRRVSAVMTGGGVVCLAAVVLTFGVYVCNMRWEITESSVIKINLLTSVAFIQMVYIAGVHATSVHEVCYTVALVLHYLFLVASFWMLSYGLHLYRCLLRSSAQSAQPACAPPPRSRFYCVLSWALPGLVVLLSVLVNPRGYETRRYCWLSIQRGMLLSFIVPISILIVAPGLTSDYLVHTQANTTLMVLVLRNFFAQKPTTHKNDIEKIRCALRAGVVLLPLLAVNWFFGVLALENKATYFFEGVFAATNSLLGILLFTFFCAADPQISCSPQAWRRCRPPAAIRLRRSCLFPTHGCPVEGAAEVSPRSDAQPLLLASSDSALALGARPCVTTPTAVDCSAEEPRPTPLCLRV